MRPWGSHLFHALRGKNQIAIPALTVAQNRMESGNESLYSGTMKVQLKSITLQATTLPTAQESQKELEELCARVRLEKTAGREIVVVVGLGFVGIVMAAVIADAADGQGKPTKFVIGLQRPSPKSYWKIPALNRGEVTGHL